MRLSILVWESLWKIICSIYRFTDNLSLYKYQLFLTKLSSQKVFKMFIRNTNDSKVTTKLSLHIKLASIVLIKETDIIGLYIGPLIVFNYMSWIYI